MGPLVDVPDRLENYFAGTTPVAVAYVILFVGVDIFIKALLTHIVVLSPE